MSFDDEGLPDDIADRIADRAEIERLRVLKANILQKIVTARDYLDCAPDMINSINRDLELLDSLTH